MVLCAYAVKPEQEEELRKMGVKDSKLLTESQRNSLRGKLEEFGEFVVKSISAEELTDKMRKRVSLNDIEAHAISEMLLVLAGRVKISKVLVDSPDPVASKFEKRIRKHFDHKLEIVCEHKADLHYPVVGAASIIAKTTRDAQIKEIKNILREEGLPDWDFGSGYSHDERTISFLKKHHSLPALQPFIRHQWQTAKNLKTTQMDLSKFSE